jgi:hypothetical protein
LTDELLTPVERNALGGSYFTSLYEPEERIPTLVVDNFPALGKLAALRFLERVQDNPEGVVSLPTGKTPEHFIGWVQRLLAGWGTPEVQTELKAAGIDPARKPQMSDLHFVQIDEFYPIEPTQANSFFSYVKRFYLEGFGLREDRALLMDCRQIADGIQQEPHIDYPATALQGLPMARFYITTGAAKLLGRRRLELVERAVPISAEMAERIVVDLAASCRSKVVDLTEEDFAADPEAQALLAKWPASRTSLTEMVRDSLVAKIERGYRMLSDTRFLHTEPHHDDLMIGYLPHIVRHTRDASNTHYFACLTGGFTAVTNQLILGYVQRLAVRLDSDEFGQLLAEGYFDPDSLEGRNRDVWQYLDGVAAASDDARHEGAARRFLRNLISNYGDSSRDSVRTRLETLLTYFATRHPGQKDSDDVQRLKSMCREWEAECIWGYFGWTAPTSWICVSASTRGTSSHRSRRWKRMWFPSSSCSSPRPLTWSASRWIPKPAVPTRITRSCSRSQRLCAGMSPTRVAATSACGAAATSGTASTRVRQISLSPSH